MGGGCKSSREDQDYTSLSGGWNEYHITCFADLAGLLKGLEVLQARDGGSVQGGGSIILLSDGIETHPPWVKDVIPQVRLLYYYLIKEIKTWLNINHITQ